MSSDDIKDALTPVQEEVESAAVPILEETYELVKPYAYVLIQTDPKTKRTQYIVVEVPLENKEKKVYNTLMNILEDELDVPLDVLKDDAKIEEYLERKVKEAIKRYGISIEKEPLKKIMYYIKRDLIGFGKIDPLMKDHMIEDISCDGVNIPIYVWHRKYESIRTNIVFETEEELDSFIIKLAQRSGRHISISNPLLDATLPDGSRIQMTFGREVTQRGSTFTIRKFRADPLTIVDLIAFNTLDAKIAAYYWFLIENRISVLIVGGVASGKTTLLNCLSMMIKPDMKIITIEDTAELNLPHENWIPSVARLGFGIEQSGHRRGEISMFELLKAALRQRPDYVIVGEVRGAEAYTLFQAMSTGHLGMATIHGDSVEGIIHRLESEPMNIPRQLITALDIIHVQRKLRYAGKFVRRTMNITEIIGQDPVTKEIMTNKVFQWNQKNDTFTFFGRSYIIEKIMERTGMSEEECWDEIERREKILRWLVKKNIRHFSDVSAVIREYYANPDKVFQRAVKDLEE